MRRPLPDPHESSKPVEAKIPPPRRTKSESETPIATLDSGTLGDFSTFKPQVSVGGGVPNDPFDNYSYERPVAARRNEYIMDGVEESPPYYFKLDPIKAAEEGIVLGRPDVITGCRVCDDQFPPPI